MNALRSLVRALPKRVPLSGAQSLRPAAHCMASFSTLQRPAANDLLNANDLPPMPDWQSLLSYYGKEAHKVGEVEEKPVYQDAKPFIPTVDSKGRAYATGKRKTSVARVWVQRGEWGLRVNGRPYVDYFPWLSLRESVTAPFAAAGAMSGYQVNCTVKGGGLSGQAQAVGHGIARALQAFDEGFRAKLKAGDAFSFNVYKRLIC
jgi:small subunit ribosomal protein S9